MSWRHALPGLLFLVPLGTGCTRSESTAPPPAASDTAPEPKVDTITVEQALARARDGQLTWVDANSGQTRQNEGIIPGALLLSSFNGFEGRELGPDKDRTYVFYCTSRL